MHDNGDQKKKSAVKAVSVPVKRLPRALQNDDDDMTLPCYGAAGWRHFQTKSGELYPARRVASARCILQGLPELVPEFVQLSDLRSRLVLILDGNDPIPMLNTPR